MHRERSAAPAPPHPESPQPARQELFKLIYFLISETKKRDAAGSPGRRAAPALRSERCAPGFAVHGFQLLLLCSATRPLGLVSMWFYFFILFFIVVINLFSCLLRLLHRLMEGRGGAGCSALSPGWLRSQRFSLISPSHFGTPRPWEGDPLLSSRGGLSPAGTCVLPVPRARPGLGAVPALLSVPAAGGRSPPLSRLYCPGHPSQPRGPAEDPGDKGQ